MKTYFARPVGRETPIKIGRSMHPEGRVAADIRWRGHKCELLATFAGDIEGRLHAQFADWHEGGEWFTATPALLDTVDAVASGNFDPSGLPKRRRLGGCGRHFKAHIGKFAEASA